MTGIGGDLFAIVYDAKTKTLHGLNASGRSAYAATPAEYAKRGQTRMPGTGVLSVTVPGVVEGWSELLTKYGSVPMSRVVAPAVDYARNGYPVSEIISGQWKASERKLASDPVTAATFLPNGHALQPGEIFSNPHLADTLELVGKTGRDAFYKGPIARAIVADMKKRDGLLDEKDFADHKADWVEPIATNYRGYDVYELPPNTQGFVVLEMLNILEGFDVKAMGPNSADYLHALVEAKRTRRDSRVGQQQAKLYADCLENHFSQRPVIFYSNGYEHWLWDDANYPPRQVQGFYKKAELELLVQRRRTRKTLADATIDGTIVERHYQNRAIRRVAEAFERDGERKALVVMATGAGKTRTVIALCELLMRCNWVKRTLFLADRVALVNQAVNAFKKHLPGSAPVNLVTQKNTEGRVYEHSRDPDATEDLARTGPTTVEIAPAQRRPRVS